MWRDKFGDSLRLRKRKKSPDGKTYRSPEEGRSGVGLTTVRRLPFGQRSAPRRGELRVTANAQEPFGK